MTTTARTGWLADPTADPAPIDPFQVTANGPYADELVLVTRGALEAAESAGRVRTPHFLLDWSGDRLQLTHRLPRHRIDNDLAGLLSDELFGTGWVSGTEMFQRLLTGIVLSSAPEPVAAWELFYRNTLRRLEFLHSSPAGSCGRHQHGSLVSYAPVYSHAIELAGFGSVLEVASCFGFLSLLMGKRGAQVTASDVSAGTVELLSCVAPLLGVGLATLTCDAARVPAPPGSFDVVAVVHLLEHLEPVHGVAVVAEATRLARDRVIVAVPYEAEATAAFGHVRVVTEADLVDLGARATADGAWSAQVHNFHGGWLVLDRSR